MEQFCKPSEVGQRVCNAWLYHALKHCRKLADNEHLDGTLKTYRPEINAYSLLLPNHLIHPQSLDLCDCVPLFWDFVGHYVKKTTYYAIASVINSFFETVVIALFGLTALASILLLVIGIYRQHNRKRVEKAHHTPLVLEKCKQIVPKVRLHMAREELRHLSIKYFMESVEFWASDGTSMFVVYAASKLAPLYNVPGRVSPRSSYYVKITIGSTEVKKCFCLKRKALVWGPNVDVHVKTTHLFLLCLRAASTSGGLRAGFKNWKRTSNCNRLHTRNNSRKYFEILFSLDFQHSYSFLSLFNILNTYFNKIY